MTKKILGVWSAIILAILAVVGLFIIEGVGVVGGVGRVVAG